MPEPEDLDPQIADLARRDEGVDGVDTEIASFFDAGYVSPNQQKSVVATNSRARSRERRQARGQGLKR